MAHVERRRQRRADGSLGPSGWRARYRDPTGKERSKTFVKRIDAERFLTSVEHSKLSGAYVDPALGKVTFREFAEKWRAVQPHRAGTKTAVEQHLRLHIYPVIGDRPIAAIKRSEIQGLVAKLGQPRPEKGKKDRPGLRASTIAVVYGRVVAVFEAAMRDRVISSTPCDEITLPTPPPRRAEVLLPEQVAALAGYVPGRYRALILFAAATGLRPGEVFGLTVDRVDFLRGTVTVDRQLVRVRGKGVDFGEPKTAASYRTIPVPENVTDLLASHLSQWPAHESGIIFTNQRGLPVQGHPFAEVWRTAKKKPDIPTWATPHHLRHFYASVLIRSGASVKVVQTRLGHSSAKTTLDLYAHLFPEEEDRTRDAIEAELDGLAAWTRPEQVDPTETPRSEAQAA